MRMETHRTLLWSSIRDLKKALKRGYLVSIVIHDICRCVPTTYPTAKMHDLPRRQGVNDLYESIPPDNIEDSPLEGGRLFVRENFQGRLEVGE